MIKGSAQNFAWPPGDKGRKQTRDRGGLGVLGLGGVFFFSLAEKNVLLLTKQKNLSPSFSLD